MAREFADRYDAAAQLATALARLRGTRPLVLAIPRGAVPIARVVADALDGELDVVLVRKLGAPHNPELAIGAVDEHGHVELLPYAAQASADEHYVRAEAARQLERIRQRRRMYGERTAHSARGRTVIVVDDGLATGATMIAALASVRAQGPTRVICAVPVAARDSLERVAPYADDVVCLWLPREFHCVGQFYRDFGEVSDADVLRLLQRPPQTRTADETPAHPDRR